MNYEVLLNNGQVFVLNNAVFEAEQFTASLNSQQTVFVNLGGAIINKHLIQGIFPVTEVVEATE